MNISEPTIKALQEIITGNIGISPYRSGPKLVDFFNRFGKDDSYGQGFPSRWAYAQDCIQVYNGTPILKPIILAAIDPRDYFQRYIINDAIEYLNKFLVYDNYKIVTKDENGFYDIIIINLNLIDSTVILDRLSHDFINEQIQKAQNKIKFGDFDGAITNARSLVEAVQEELIVKSGNEVLEYGGDLVKLYKMTKKSLNLDVDHRDLSDTLKQILNGLNSINAGLAGLSNKMADRHYRAYKPKEHHARLAVNSSLTFSLFLVDIFYYQQSCNKQENYLFDRSD